MKYVLLCLMLVLLVACSCTNSDYNDSESDDGETKTEIDDSSENGETQETDTEKMSIQQYDIDEDKGIVFSNVSYTSDELAIDGFLAHPQVMEGKMPLIVYNRGGVGRTGALTDKSFKYFASYYAENGYIVIASNYRGSNGDYHDGYGGEDLNDVINLVKYSKELEFVDLNQIYMIGVSRGGLMTYMALREIEGIKAAVVISAMTDFTKLYNERSNAQKNKYETAIGGSPETLPEEYERRSPYIWADEINTPILIIHGNKDNVVDVSHAKNMEETLMNLGKACQVIYYENDSHGIMRNMESMTSEIISYFNNSNLTPSDNKTIMFIKDNEGNTYKSVKIGKQWWMAENARATKDINGNNLEYVYYEDNTENEYLGYLYDYENAMKISIDGWHLPSHEDFKELEVYLGMSVSDADKIGSVDRGPGVGDKLKSGSTIGFDAKPYGWYAGDENGYGGFGEGIAFWTSDMHDEYNAIVRTIMIGDDRIYCYPDPLDWKFYVRLVRAVED